MLVACEFVWSRLSYNARNFLKAKQLADDGMLEVCQWSPGYEWETALLLPCIRYVRLGTKPFLAIHINNFRLPMSSPPPRNYRTIRQASESNGVFCNLD